MEGGRGAARGGDEELDPASVNNMEEVEAEFAVVQSTEMAKQEAILKSIQDEACVEANWQLIRHKRATTNALFAEFDAEAEHQSCGCFPYPEPSTKIVDIFHEN
ncbi:hypothetical protein D1007_10399 [Hordeum vulgare]|nr:hypothetical protein D1007_10399 [Hordeum vulgare]